MKYAAQETRPVLNAAPATMRACAIAILLTAAQAGEPVGELEMPSQWRAFYPLDRAAELPVETLARFPDQLVVDGQTHAPKTVSPTRNQYDFEMDLGETAYVFVPLNVPTAQTVTLGFGADWWMQAWLNGAEIVNTLREGNASWPPTITDYRANVDLKAGDNILAVRFISGRGSSILAIGGPIELETEDFASIAQTIDREYLPAMPDVPREEIFSETRYVSPEGSDENPGTRDRPWKTVQHAVDRAGPGAVIRLARGTFHEQILIRRSGREGEPITIEGARDERGDRLSRIDAGRQVDPRSWQPAPEIGPNVYQNTTFPSEPQIVTVGGKFLVHAHRRHDGSAFPLARSMEIIAWPEDHRLPQRLLLVTRRLDKGLRFWDALGGLYVHHPDPERGITYLRLAESAGEVDPRKRNDIAISDGGAVITIHDAAHVVLRGLEITRGNIGIRIAGPEARHNLVDDCFVTHGRTRVEIAARAAHNTVRNSHLAMGFFGARPGAWGRGNDMETAARECLYRFFKYAHSANVTSDDRAVRVHGDAMDTTIEGCHLDGGLIGVSSASNRGLTVRNSTINGFSSVGLVLSAGTIDARIQDNLIHDGNINIRLHHLNAPGTGHRAHIYRNRVFQWGGAQGNRHFFCHGLPRGGQETDPEIVIYHNTFIGGGPFFNLNARVGPTPNIRFLNNVIATDRPPFLGGAGLMQDARALGPFAYNWLGGGFRSANLPAWFGPGNVSATGERPWPRDELPDFRLPPGHAARNTGIDLSSPFTIDGVTYDPLPGMTPGYFHGPRPDMGAVQHN